MDIQTYIKEFADQFEETDASLFTEDTAFHELDEWDSLIALAVLNMTQKKFGKKITFGEMRICSTIGELYKIVESK